MNMKLILLWVRGMAVAAISAFCSAAAGALALPTVFTLNKVGLINMGKLGIPPAILAVLLYLKQSPLPPLIATLDAQGNLQSVSGSVEVNVTKK